MDQSKIGSFLKSLRKEKGLTQEQLAEKFNVAVRTVSRWENGNNMPDISILVELADFYDVDIRDIINGERKSENMDETMKDTLTTVADYSDAEKEIILKKLRTNIIACIIVFAAIFVTRVFNVYNIHSDMIGDICDFLPYLGIVFSVQGLIQMLQIKGDMTKNRLKKLNVVLLPVTIAVIFLSSITILLLVIYVPKWNKHNTENIEGYDLGFLLDTYGSDLNSDLSVFPWMADVPADSTYYDNITTGILDTDAVIVLDCTYSSDKYIKETERLASLNKVIMKDGHKYINHVVYDDEQYALPAYITIDGFGHTYEYALTDDASQRITYVYLSYPNINEDDKYLTDRPEILKKDLMSYEKADTTLLYSMYNHSFDGGRSFTEFDDIQGE